MILSADLDNFLQRSKLAEGRMEHIKKQGGDRNLTDGFLSLFYDFINLKERLG